MQAVIPSNSTKLLGEKHLQYCVFDDLNSCVSISENCRYCVTLRNSFNTMTPICSISTDIFN